MATSGVDLSLSGLSSGLDWKTLVQQLANAERGGEARLQTQQSALNQKNSLFNLIKNQLTLLQTQVTALKDPTLYDSRSATVSDATLATASAAGGTAPGAYIFNVTQLASAAQINGTANIGQPISSDGDLTAVTLGTAGFATPVTAGTFTVNGKQVTVATTDTLQQVFNKIATATSNVVTASYSTSGDTITLATSDSSKVVLGSATDTSNFLAVARLYNNDTTSVTSSKALGSVRTSAALVDAHTNTAITGGATGKFTINGVNITYNATTDSVSNVLTRINNSAAGVTASYDTQNDRFVITNKTVGDIGVAMTDVTGNFLAATGLTGGTLTHGKNCLYTVNGGDPLVSQTNTINQDSSGITGLSVTALKENSPVTVTVASDTSKVKTAIQTFISAYNTVESYIATQSVSTTDATGKVTAGALASDRSATDLATSLRTKAFASITGLTGTINKLADLGIQTNGHDNNLALKDSAALDSALANKLGDIKTFFSDTTNGLAVKLDSFLTKTIGDNGSLVAHQANLTKQATDIDSQIAAMEKVITANSNRWTAQFIAMESTQARMSQQLSYLQQQLGSL